MKKVQRGVLDKYFLNPINAFIGKSTTSGILLFATAILAMIIANSPLKDWYHHLWHIHFKIGFDQFMIDKSLHHWINDGLMAIFFFVVGLELKREIISGELSNPKNAILPLGAAIGGMVVPALIYLAFNSSAPASDGWGIPMATDIAFALGLLYLLGKNVPLSLKVFLTALAIADDIGAVLVIAFFYTSQIDTVSLLTGVGFLSILIIANRLGVKNALFYGVIGIVGLWTAFLMSGIHATIAAVLAAFTIPASAKVPENVFTRKMNILLTRFNDLDPTKEPTLSHDQLVVMEQMKKMSNKAMPPLQKLEHGMHSLVAFIVMPIFAFANAGVTIEGNFIELLLSPITLGIILGLILGKLIGVLGVSLLMVKFKIAPLPEGMNKLHLVGAGFLAAIGFTMSLFISGLAFEDPVLGMQAKIGVLVASLLASIIGFLIIKKASSKKA